MKILIIIVLLVLLGFMYKNISTLKQEKLIQEKLIKQLKIDLKIKLLETTKKNSTKKIIKQKNKDDRLLINIDLLDIQLEEKDKKDYIKEKNILDFENNLKKEEEKEDDLQISISPDLTLDLEKKNLEIESIKIEIKTKF